MSKNQISNNAKPISFQLIFDKIPEVVYKLQTINLPTVSVNPTRGFGTGHSELFIPGDTVVFEDSIFDFIVDEDFTNYEKMFEWFKEITTNKSLTDRVSNATLTILDNNKVPIRFVQFEDMFPVIMADVFFINNTIDSTLTCSVTCKMSQFYFEDIKKN